MSAISDSLTVSCVDCSISFQVASPCQQYLIALQSHVLREAVLFNIPEENQADIDEAKRKLKVQ